MQLTIARLDDLHSNSSDLKRMKTGDMLKFIKTKKPFVLFVCLFFSKGPDLVPH